MSEQEIKVEVDASKIREEIRQEIPSIVEKIIEAKELERGAQDTEGRGSVEEATSVRERNEAILENLRKGVEEQWSVAIPKSTHEAAAHIRDFCYESPVLENAAGDRIDIPYVTDFDLKLLGSVGASTTCETGVISSTYATIVENHAWTRVGYHEVEKYDSNILEQINSVFARAAIRAEDRRILTAIGNEASTDFASQIDHSGVGTDFVANWIPAAIGDLMAAGKDISPGECVAYLSPEMYEALLVELGSSTPAALVTPDVLKNGRVTEYMGIHLVVGPKTWISDKLSGSTTSHYCAIIGRLKRGVVFAPKRDVLIETERDTTERDLKITGSHTMAVKVIDPAEMVEILTSA